MSNKAHHTFEKPEQLHAWLRANHTSESELWARNFKKSTGQPGVTWDDCVVATIAWQSYWQSWRAPKVLDIFDQRLNPNNPKKTSLQTSKYLNLNNLR